MTEPTDFTAQEATAVHTRALKVSLAPDEARAFWREYDPQLPKADLALTAFEGRWFGNKSVSRVKDLINACFERFVAFPHALEVLRRWLPRDATTHAVICHWHVQLADPLYRDFTTRFLGPLRLRHQTAVDRDLVSEWLRERWGERWSLATIFRMASGLMTTAQGAGLLSDGVSRQLRMPDVPDEALAYLLYALRRVQYDGDLLDNPYLASVDLQGAALRRRLDRLPGITFQSMMQLTDMTWEHPDLMSWARAHLHLRTVES